MTANSPSSYSVSVMLHGAFVAAVVLTAWVLKDHSLTKEPKILELVAGEGDNWAAKEATALGTPSGVKFEPAPEPPKPAPVAPAPEPVAPPPMQAAPVQPPPEPVVVPVERPPVTPAPVAPVTPKKPAVKKPEPTFSEMVKQRADRKERLTMAQFRKEQAAKAKIEAKAAELKKNQQTKAEFDRENAKKLAANTKNGTPSYQRIDTKGLATGVSGGKTDQAGAGGPALSREEQDQLDTYFKLLIEKLKAVHEKPADVGDGLSTEVEFMVASNGAIGKVRITKSSGNAEFDQSVLAAFTAVRTIGPPPSGRSETAKTRFLAKELE